MGRESQGKHIMKLQSVTTLAALALAAGTGAALAHHSFAMFDAEHPMESQAW